FFSSRRRHTRFSRDWSSDVCSSDLAQELLAGFYLRPHVAHFIWLLNTTIRIVSCTRQLIFEMCSDSRRGVGAGGPGGRAARRREPGSSVQPVRRSRSACSTAGDRKSVV